MARYPRRWGIARQINITFVLWQTKLLTWSKVCIFKLSAASPRVTIGREYHDRWWLVGLAKNGMIARTSSDWPIKQYSLLLYNAIHLSNSFKTKQLAPV